MLNIFAIRLNKRLFLKSYMLEVSSSDLNSLSLLDELEEILQHRKIRGLARLPEPRPSERYRDVLTKLYKNVGLCQAVVWLEDNRGKKAAYVFLLKANPKGGEGNWLDAKVHIEGYKVEFEGEKIRKIKYQPVEFEKSSDVIKRIEEVAEKYQEAETKLTFERAISFDPYAWT